MPKKCRELPIGVSQNWCQRGKTVNDWCQHSRHIQIGFLYRMRTHCTDTLNTMGVTSFPKVHLCTVFAVFVSLISKLEKLHNNTTSERMLPHCFNVNDFTRVDNEWNYQVFVPHDLSCLSLRVGVLGLDDNNITLMAYPIHINYHMCNCKQS